jgi:hypothetical protein
MLTSVARAQTPADTGDLTVRIMTADGQPVVAAEVLLQARRRVDKVVYRGPVMAARPSGPSQFLSQFGGQRPTLRVRNDRPVSLG